MGDISINLGESLIPFFYERLKTWFGEDEYSQHIKGMTKNRIRTSIEQSREVLIAGMSSPTSLRDSYRTLRVSRGQSSTESRATVDALILGGQSAILIAPPGHGKSVTIKHACLLLAEKKQAIPLRYALRERKSIRELFELLSILKTSKRDKVSKLPIVLLLDGYDEISYPQRIRLSESLRELQGIEDVRFLLTCRAFYEIVDLPISRYFLLPFTEKDAEAYLSFFLEDQGSQISSQQLIVELHARGFSDFLGNPLLLTLCAILQRGDTPQIPRNAVRLLTEVTEYLTFQWDKERGVDRETLQSSGIDGHDLLACLKRIADSFAEPEGSVIIASAKVKEHLDLRQIVGVDPQIMLLELAKWFGFFVPAEGQWSFVHLTIHDFLAAKYMVENGTLAFEGVRRNWRRAYYAACMVPDATTLICRSLQFSGSLEMFVECSANDAYFNPVIVAKSLLRFYEQPRESCSLFFDKERKNVQVTLQQDYLKFLKTRFLIQWLELALSRVEKFNLSSLISTALAVSELIKRDEVPSLAWRNAYPNFSWSVNRLGLLNHPGAQFGQ